MGQTYLSSKNIAISFAKKGIRVFPCNMNKSPLTPNGFKDATDDIKTIEKWWDTYPDALIGSPNDQFSVIDVDDYDIPDSAKYPVQHAIDMLKESGIINDSSIKVTTMSGGTHYYFKKNDLGRSIKALPQIDVLGDGGYVILPDQKNYKSDIDSPWNSFDTLPSLDTETLDQLSKKFEIMTKAVSKETKDYRKAMGLTKVRFDSIGPKGSVERQLRYKEEHKTFIEMTNDPLNEDKHIGYIDRNSDKIHFEVKNGLYEKRHPDRVTVKSDPSDKIIKDGKLNIEIKEGCLTDELIQKIYHNQEVQIHLASHMGVKIPKSFSRGVSFKSMIPGHEDKNPSSGSRWSQDRSHIIVRDFANSSNDMYKQIDYDLVRLYVTKKYGTTVGRLSGPEWTTWFVRMLEESGLINIDHMEIPFCKDLDTFFRKNTGESQKRLARSFQYLVTLKSLHHKFDGVTAFAIKFACAWSGVSVGNVGQARHALVKKGILVQEGKINCNPNRTDGFFNTGSFRLRREDEVDQLPAQYKKEALDKTEQKTSDSKKMKSVIEASKLSDDDLLKPKKKDPVRKQQKQTKRTITKKKFKNGSKIVVKGKERLYIDNSGIEYANHPKLVEYEKEEKRKKQQRPKRKMTYKNDTHREAIKKFYEANKLSKKMDDVKEKMGSGAIESDSLKSEFWKLKNEHDLIKSEAFDLMKKSKIEEDSRKGIDPLSPKEQESRGARKLRMLSRIKIS